MISPTLEHMLSTARHCVVLTGAGVSAESGVPTFRSAGGLWKNHNPQDLATPEAFSADPALVWSWYSWRRRTVRGVDPNPGHYALAEAATLFPRLTLITQNVDNLHQRAGSTGVLELHGNIEHCRCSRCTAPYHGDRAPPTDEVQYCACGGPLRPGVVWFGEGLPMDMLDAAQQAARNCDLFLSVGTSALVYPAAMLPLLARQAGAYVVEINTAPSALAQEMDECISGPSGVVLPLLLDTLRRHRGSA
ncbi:MAG: NAD-dependent deacylase [Bacteroidota bacterium]|nr:NAD-dependent deacylase [Bacteroidota bacterium]